MSRSEPPTEEQARALALAIAWGFEKPCDCRVHDDHVHACAGHEWLVEDPTRRMGVRVWQRLLWMRTQRAALLAQEGLLVRSHRDAPLDPVGILPW